MKSVKTTVLENVDLQDVFYKMVLVRRFEERMEKLYQQGKIHGTIHLSIGQEAASVGAVAVLEKKDKILTHHRGHGHAIAKGVDLKPFVAEILGKSTGLLGGRGGHIHLADIENGNIGANGILGASATLATGIGLTSKMKKLGYVVVCFFGDGASNEGAIHEAMNLASIWELPVIFFCDNNQYGMSGPIKDMINIENISDRAAGYGMPGITVDGSDVLEVMNVTKTAAERARNGGGPTFIEAKTYRFKGHSRSDARKYRTREEEAEWMNTKDPVALFRAQLYKDGILNEQLENEIEEKVLNKIEEAVMFAEESPIPSIEVLDKHVYFEN
jgi:acetoin:2,6-dichlorophenolindophenol oxidoreductase subunit alpha